MAQCPRSLTDAEQEKLTREENICDFLRAKLEKESKKNWDLFYKRNSTNFFKDRRWLTREFPEISELNKVWLVYYRKYLNLA